MHIYSAINGTLWIIQHLTQNESTCLFSCCFLAGLPPLCLEHCLTYGRHPINICWINERIKDSAFFKGSAGVWYLVVSLMFPYWQGASKQSGKCGLGWTTENRWFFPVTRFRPGYFSSVWSLVVVCSKMCALVVYRRIFIWSHKTSNCISYFCFRIWIQTMLETRRN